jgi:hypothetical protein
MVLRLRAMGAKGIATENVTSLFQQGIDSLRKQGGGTLLLDSGTFLTGSVRLQSHIFIEIAGNAMWQGAADLGAYPLGSLLVADSCINCGIRGEGTLDGNGAAFFTKDFQPLPRPEPWLLFQNCREVKIADVFFRNAPAHGLVFRACSEVTIEGIRMVNPMQSPNTDGIDLYDSRRVHIRRCSISTGDDAICIKSKKGEMGDIHVEDCVLESDDAAWKIGTGTAGVIRNCTMKRTRIQNSRYGIAIFMLEGGSAEQLVFEDVQLHTASRHGAEYPIFMDIDRKRKEDALGNIRGVRMERLTIETSGKVLIAGQPGAHIEQISIRNLDLKLHNPIHFARKKKPRGNKNFPHLPGSADYASVPATFTIAHSSDFTIESLQLNSNNTITDRKTAYLHEVQKGNFGFVSDQNPACEHSFEIHQSTGIRIFGSPCTGTAEVDKASSGIQLEQSPGVKIRQGKK